MTDTTTTPTNERPGSYHHGDLPSVLMAASADLIAERGPHAFSLREVARRAGVSHAAPAHHFGSARGLLTAVATEGFELLERALTEAYESDDDPREQLRRGGSAYVATALRYPGHYAVMFADELHDPDDEPLVIAGCGAYERLLECVERIRDQLNPDLDVETAATMAWATMAGLVVLSPSLPNVAEQNDLTFRPIDELIERFTALFMDGFIHAR
ncbi:MAG: helix-turn-helix domain-containing protein [Actinomycetota bacterium]